MHVFNVNEAIKVLTVSGCGISEQQYRWQNYSETRNMLEYGAALTSKTNNLKFFIYIRLSMQMLDIKKNDMLAHWQFFVGNMHNIHTMWHEKKFFH